MNLERKSEFDLPVVFIYFALVIFGWINVYASSYDLTMPQNMWDITGNGVGGKQLLWIMTSIGIIVIIKLLNFKVFEIFAFPIYAVFLLLLIYVLVFGKEVAGSKSWIDIGSFALQPSEFAKVGTALLLAKFINNSYKKNLSVKSYIISSFIILTPVGLIMIQGDTGSAMVYFSLIIVLYRIGLNQMIMVIGIGLLIIFVLTLLVNKYILLILIGGALLLGIALNAKDFKKILLIVLVNVLIVGTIFSVDFVMNNVLKPHQQKRILLLLNPDIDPLGIGWNVTQSKIAIGSGGFYGKGFLEGTQTKFDFVPEQTTDFIFCTVGEEHGFIGTTVLLGLFGVLFYRLIYLAERQKNLFSRMYGYAVLSILFFHFAINISMTMGLFPIIGIPLPFFSYGGSSLWSFTMLLFIFLSLDAHRNKSLQRI